MRIAHLLVRLFQSIELGLLLSGQERTKLRGGVFHEGFHLQHGFLMDRSDLRFRLIDDWLDFRFLIGREVKRFDHLAEMPASASSMPATRASIACLRDGKSAQGQRANYCECNQLSFHILYSFFVGRTMRPVISG